MTSIIFPYSLAAQSADDTGSRSAGKSTQSSQKKLKVLIVDDERLIADTIAEILEAGGYEATALYDGESALTHCQETCPEIVISDYVLPGINGLELAGKLREYCPTARVFLLTGQANLGGMAERMRSRGHDFEILAKPLHPEELFERLKHRKS
jgi:PleD family two-component response regulator